MKPVEKKYDVGVIIGRFQIHKLHSEHKKLIEYVLERHDKVIMFLGISPAINTRKNPLDFLSRKVMIEEAYGNRISYIAPLHDRKFNDAWAKQVDAKVREVIPMGSVVLYGSKDSFIPFYTPHGSFDTCELEPDNFVVSATDVREEIRNQVLMSEEFRAGVIYAANSTFPHVFTTIDVAILNEESDKVLLGRKSTERKFRFVGGFSDVEDENFEQTTRREAMEETKLQITDPEYISSRRVDDWRYRSDKDRAVITLFFKAKKMFGGETASDDIEEVKWFDIADVRLENLVDEHVHLFKDLKNNLNIK